MLILFIEIYYLFLDNNIILDLDFYNKNYKFEIFNYKK